MATRAGSTVTVGAPRRLFALVVVAFLLLVEVAGPASARDLPKGAYWYQLLDLPTAWHITEGKGVTVAVVDQGVQADVGDLLGQVLPGLDLTGSLPAGRHEVAEPGTGGFGHGTDMATLIAGTGKGAGLEGVAPQAKILPVAVGSGGTLTDPDIARGISWAADHGAEVINVSLGGPGPCSAVLAAAIKHAYDRDAIVVAAAGEPAGPVYSPANCAGALAISAVDAAIKPWAKTASGPEVAFAAPGFGLVNELLTDKLYGPDPLNSGTSQAAAIASGTFALLRARFPTESARQIVTRALYNTHNGLGEGHLGERAGNYLGYGMVLPRFALTEPVPATPRNPIYDQWARDFGTSTPSNAPASAPPASSTRSVPSAAPSGELASPSPSPASASSGDGGGISAAVIVIIAVVALAAIAGVVVLVRRRGGPRGPSGYPPAPPGYGPPG